MSSTAGAGGKKDSTLVTVLCGLGLAIAFLAIGSAFIPFLDKLAVLISVPAMLIAASAMGLALLRNTRLVLPALALTVAGAPAARENWVEMHKVWVESTELCNSPTMGNFSILSLVGDLALGAEHKKIVGSQVCRQLGKRFTDDDCDGPVGRIKCEL
jgi:hypothetical protein